MGLRLIRRIHLEYDTIDNIMGALAALIEHVKETLPSQGFDLQYCAASSRSKDALKALLDVAGRLYSQSGTTASFAQHLNRKLSSPSRIK